METAQVLADEIHKVMLDAHGFHSYLAADDESLPVGKIANMTTDTASVMSSTARILSNNYRLFQGMTWTPCMCHVLNLFLVDQEKTFQAIKILIAQGKVIITVFRNSAPRKLFQRYEVHDLIHSAIRYTFRKMF
jgi:hypothetical protein